MKVTLGLWSYNRFMLIRCFLIAWKALPYSSLNRHNEGMNMISYRILDLSISFLTYDNSSARGHIVSRLPLGIYKYQTSTPKSYYRDTSLFKHMSTFINPYYQVSAKFQPWASIQLQLTLDFCYLTERYLTVFVVKIATHLL